MTYCFLVCYTCNIRRITLVSGASCDAAKVALPISTRASYGPASPPPRLITSRLDSQTGRGAAFCVSIQRSAVARQLAESPTPENSTPAHLERPAVYGRPAWPVVTAAGVRGCFPTPAYGGAAPGFVWPSSETAALRGAPLRPWPPPVVPPPALDQTPRAQTVSNQGGRC